MKYINPEMTEFVLVPEAGFAMSGQYGVDIPDLIEGDDF